MRSSDFRVPSTLCLDGSVIISVGVFLLVSTVLRGGKKCIFIYSTYVSIAHNLLLKKVTRIV